MKWWNDGIPMSDELNKKIDGYEKETGKNDTELIVELLEKHFGIYKDKD